MFTTSSASPLAPIVSPAVRQGLRSSAKRGALLPPKIGAALGTINTDPRFRGLSLTARNVLMFIVQVTDAKDPLKPSWAFKETIANHLGIGEATVYRMLKVLIENDFVERLGQERKSRNGRYAVSRLRLTPECCAILGLIARKRTSDERMDAGDSGENIVGENNCVAKSSSICLAASPRNPVKQVGERMGNGPTVPPSPNDKMIDGYMDILPTADQQTQSSKQSRPVGCRKPEAGQNYLRVPREFFWLIDENRLTPSQTCKLMREFSSRGQRLGDAVSALAKRLREIPKNKTYAYLSSLAKGPTDFAWLCKQQTKAETESRKKAVVREKTINLQGMAGKYLLSANQTHLFLLRGGHAEAWWLDNGVLRRGMQPINPDFVEAFAKGRLSEISQESAADTLSLWGRLN